MYSYNDENMMQRMQFVANIPYLRGLERDTIMQIVYLIDEHVFEQGEKILDR